MIDNYNPDIFEQLKLEVETLVGRPIKTPKDFEFLSCQIEGYTRETISVSTLKRMWGYVASNCNPSKYNLNLLSRMVGYPDWSSFVGGQEGLSSSRFFVKSKLIADALQKGELVKLTWCPGRVLTIMYKGNDTFEVVESINSKLAKGDTFTCPQFVEDQPLYLSNLSHPGIPLCNYVAGQNGGIKWNLGGGNFGPSGCIKIKNKKLGITIAIPSFFSLISLGDAFIISLGVKPHAVLRPYEPLLRLPRSRRASRIPG